MNTPQIVYATQIDISLPNGPGVNEREFVSALSRMYGERARFVIAEPSDRSVLQGLSNVRTFRLPGSRAMHFFSELSFFLALLAECKQCHPSLVVSRSGALPFALVAFSRLTKVPLALKTYGEATLKYLCDQPGLKGWVARRIRRLNMALADRLLESALAVDCCTDQLVRRNIAHHSSVDPSKFFHVDNATNVDRFKPESTREARVALGIERFSHVIGYAGGVPWERGAVEMINGVALLGQRFPGLGCVIIGGSGPALDELKRQATNLGVAERCLVLGQIPYEQVPRWIRSFDIGVALDLDERMNYVGSSNQKIRQYLASGKPVIATAGANLFLEEERLGLTVKRGDYREIARIIEGLLLRPPALVEVDAARARSYAVKELSIESAIQKRVARWSSQLGLAL